MNERILVEVYRAEDSSHAHLIKSALAGVGIHAFVEGDLLQDAIGGIPMGWSIAPRVLVESCDAPRVHEIISRWERGATAPASSRKHLGMGRKD